MKLEIVVGSFLCYLPTFKINGIDAGYEEFGEKYDAEPENAEDYGCGNMTFTRKSSTKEILEKYKINEKEYAEICEQLEEKLSFGSCGWCI